MVRVDDPDRVFDVSRPSRTAPGATSRPLIVGHRPQTPDPMVHADDPYADYSAEKKVTSVPVTWDTPEEQTPLKGVEHQPAADDFGGESAISDKRLQDQAVAAEPEAGTKVTDHKPPSATDTLFAPNSQADKSSWHDDGQPPIATLPLGHTAGAGPRRPLKKIIAWLAGLLVLAGLGTYLAIDAGLVAANIKLPFEIFKEEKVETPTPRPMPTSPAPARVIEPEPFQLPENWTQYENKSLGIKFAYPKDWAFVDNSSVQTSTKSWYVGELTSADKKTTVAITLTRTKDGRTISTSTKDWQESASKQNVNYIDLKEAESSYEAFSYIQNIGNATSLNYVALNPGNQLDLAVLPTSTNQKTEIDTIIKSIRFE